MLDAMFKATATTASDTIQRMRSRRFEAPTSASAATTRRAPEPGWRPTAPSSPPQTKLYGRCNDQVPGSEKEGGKVNIAAGV